MNFNSSGIGDELDVESNFHVYRTRLKSEIDSWVGVRKDVLRRHEGSFLIAKRLILLDQVELVQPARRSQPDQLHCLSPTCGALECGAIAGPAGRKSRAAKAPDERRSSRDTSPACW